MPTSGGVPKICKDGRIWGQTNREAGSHLGILVHEKYQHKLTDEENRNRWKNYGIKTRFQKGHPATEGAFKKGQNAGSKHYLWKGGTERFYCRECGRKTSRGYFRCNKCGRPRGIKHYQWKGTTFLYEMIRKLSEYKTWRLKVFKKANYICENCSKGGWILRAHHIKPFTKILKEFLQEYNQFSPIEDKETLIRLAITYKPFWDIDNGMALCNDCHKGRKVYYADK